MRLITPLIALALVACGDKPADGAAKPADNKPAAAAKAGEKPAEAAKAAEKTAEAPKAGEKNQIVGTWRVDIDKMIDDPKLKEMPEQQRQMAIGMAKAIFATASFEFTADGKMNMKLGKDTKTGTYTVKNDTGATMEIETVTTKDDGSEEKEMVKVEFAGGGMQITDPKGQKIHFLKGAPDPAAAAGAEDAAKAAAAAAMKAAAAGAAAGGTEAPAPTEEKK